MLVLSRKPGERIVIGDNITIVVNRVTGNRVSIGVEAPHDVRIVRGELDQFTGEFPASAQDHPAVSPVLPFESGAAPFEVASVPFIPRVAR